MIIIYQPWDGPKVGTILNDFVHGVRANTLEMNGKVNVLSKEIRATNNHMTILDLRRCKTKKMFIRGSQHIWESVYFDFEYRSIQIIQIV